MPKVIVYIAMSLDGYIADENGGVNWLHGDGSDIKNIGSFLEFIETVDTVILGSTTYDQIVNELSPKEWAYKGKQTYVLTNKEYNSREEIIFTNQNIGMLIDNIKKKNNKNIWICGGANIISQFHNENLIDEYWITIIPIILGNGLRLFNAKNIAVNLKLLATRSYNGIVDLKYKKQ
ncbi:dihydrofolate reductase family protein [Candidatus Epulonipiscium viviparus]|uniref:dihydrofolate reductase family protein n=1 Tax=Candidatus Epulonipiscium viviparus TaxID=420336 RepID=UPI00273812DA|nr:dihydrofolate reductase family protein [Candidatus Epulopiscium viviparus]